MAAPEIVAGAVIITGVVVVAVAIKEALDAHELASDPPEEVKPTPETRPAPETQPAPPEPLAEQQPKPEESPSREDWPPRVPLDPPERERHPKCKPIPSPPRGGNDLHNKCADKVPNNTFPGSDVFVNGKNFDALQLAVRTLWEVKTDDFEKHSPHSRKFFIKMKLGEIQREARLARECGYKFIVGVHSEAHKTALIFADPSLEVVVMDWC